MKIKNKKILSKQALSLDEVKHVAELAKLSLSEADLIKFRDQLSGIIHLVNQVTQVNTENIEPTSQVTGLENIFREDEIKPSLTQDEVLANAKRKYNGYFLVDAIFE